MHFGGDGVWVQKDLRTRRGSSKQRRSMFLLPKHAGSNDDTTAADTYTHACYSCSYEAQKAHASHSLISRRSEAVD